MFVTSEKLKEGWKAVTEERTKIEKEEDHKIPKVGRTVKVIKGRKIPIGTIATVVWYGDDKFALTRASRYANPWFGHNPFGFYRPNEHRVGLMVDGKKVFTSAANVEVIEEGTDGR